MSTAFKCDACGLYFDGLPTGLRSEKEVTVGNTTLRLEVFSKGLADNPAPDLCTKCRERAVQRLSGSPDVA